LLLSLTFGIPRKDIVFGKYFFLVDDITLENNYYFEGLYFVGVNGEIVESPNHDYAIEISYQLTKHLKNAVEVFNKLPWVDSGHPISVCLHRKDKFIEENFPGVVFPNEWSFSWGPEYSDNLEVHLGRKELSKFSQRHFGGENDTS